MAFELPKLPYEMDALAPHISKQTLELHYGKHHAGYIKKLNAAVEGKAQANKSLEELICSEKGGIFNNAAQIWNHTFYWNCMSPNGGGDPQGAIDEVIKKNFDSFSGFKDQFTQASVTLFGSGWAWLVKNKDDSLAIVQTKDAGNPLTEDQIPLLTCDVWEHAYYIDYRNERPKYMEAFWSLINWEFVESQLQGVGVASQ